jgi:hypothetical protein
MASTLRDETSVNPRSTSVHDVPEPRQRSAERVYTQCCALSAVDGLVSRFQLNSVLLHHCHARAPALASTGVLL